MFNSRHLGCLLLSTFPWAYVPHLQCSLTPCEAVRASSICCCPKRLAAYSAAAQFRVVQLFRRFLCFVWHLSFGNSRYTGEPVTNWKPSGSNLPYQKQVRLHCLKSISLISRESAVSGICGTRLAEGGWELESSPRLQTQLVGKFKRL